MVEETPIRTRLIEYTETDPEGGQDSLRAVGLTDVLADGLSMVYSFFEPSLQAQSLGTFMILDHIEIAKSMDLPYVYLGYWVPGSEKMAYKAKFSGLEVFSGGAWSPLTDQSAYENDRHPLSVEPIAEQVSKISLPGKIDL
jgi:arginine-tRNA-protein transferase